MARIKVISQQEYQLTIEQAQAAQELLTGEKWQFIRDYLNNGIASIEHSILNNTVCDTKESVSLSEKAYHIKTFFFPKKVQVDEMAGQYKWIKRFILDLQSFVTIRDELNTEISKKRVKVNEPDKQVGV